MMPQLPRLATAIALTLVIAPAATLESAPPKFSLTTAVIGSGSVDTPYCLFLDLFDGRVHKGERVHAAHQRKVFTHGFTSLRAGEPSQWIQR